MKRIVRISLLSLIVLSAPGLNAQDKEQETIVCPGSGERCAYVKILGVKIWSKKDKDGPGILIKEKD